MGKTNGWQAAAGNGSSAHNVIDDVQEAFVVVVVVAGVEVSPETGSAADSRQASKSWLHSPFMQRMKYEHKQLAHRTTTGPSI